jgi:hypothetical protein
MIFIIVATIILLAIILLVIQVFIIDEIIGIYNHMKFKKQMKQTEERNKKNDNKNR